MNTLYPFERLIVEAEKMGIEVHEKHMPATMKGLYYNGVIHMEDKLSYVKKNCIMAEEIGHHLKSAGNILDQTKVMNRRQEMFGRAYAFQKLMPPRRLVDACKHGCSNLYETLEYLDVTETFFKEAVCYYSQYYGYCVPEGDYLIYFNAPGVHIIKKDYDYSCG